MRYILFIIFILVANSIASQNMPQFRKYNGNGAYGGVEVFPVKGIASDYGPRNYSPKYFHYGIDYNDTEEDYGDLLISNFEGSVVNVHGKLLRTDDKAAYIVIDVGDYRVTYLHMFYDGTSTIKTMNDGTVTLKYMIPEMNKKWAMIFIVEGDTLTLGQDTGQVKFGNDTLDVSNEIEVGTILGPLGNSGGVGAHLHLNTIPDDKDYYSDDWAKSPLQYFDYIDTTYEYTLFSRSNNSQIVLEYPGINISPLALKDKITGEGDNSTRYDAVMDINKVEFKLKNIKMDTFETIKGDTKEGIISLGGKLGEEVINHPVGSFGDWTTTGVDAFAYSSHPWDIWHYSDFVSRIHKNDVMTIGSHLYSNCPENSRYNDGEYFFKCKTIDIRDNEENTDSQSVIIDNFKPYIKSVSVNTLQSNTQIYNENWTCSNNNCINFSNNHLNTTITENEAKSGFLVTVECSEEMENLLLSIPVYNISNKAPASVSEGSIFTFRIEANEITDLTQEVILHFSGTDKNNNQVISFSPSYAQQCVSIPTKISNTGWTDPNTPDLTYGDDDIHRFKFSCAPQGGLPPGMIAGGEGTEVIIEEYDILLDVALTHPTNSGNCKDGAIDLKITGGIAPYDVTWYKVNDNGQNGEIKNAVSQSGNDGSEDLSDMEPGRYLVEVEDALCGIVSQEYELTNCACIAVNKVYQKNVLKCGNNLNTGVPYESCDGELGIDVQGAEQYEVLWSTGSTELKIFNLCTGMYSVTVTIEGCDPIINTYEICCCNNETAVDEPYPMCEMPAQINITGADITSPSSSSAADGAIDLKVEGGNGATYKWTGPNGFTANTEDISGLTIGTYCVTITNECGGIIGNCYTLVDCSNNTFTYSSHISNTCPYQETGSILIIPGENCSFTYKWDNGSENNFLTNLKKGIYTVTITNHFKGCVQNIRKAFEVKEEDTGYYISSPEKCSQSYYNCSGILQWTDEENWSCYSTDCETMTCYCSLFGNSVTTTQQRQIIGYDNENCSATVLCIDGSTEVVEGNIYTDNFFAGTCCYEWEYCAMPDGIIKVIDTRSIQPTLIYLPSEACDNRCMVWVYCGDFYMYNYCVPEPIGAEPCYYQSITSPSNDNYKDEMTFYDYMSIVIDSERLFGYKNILIPENVKESTTLREYEKILKDGYKSSFLVPIYEFENREIGCIDCCQERKNPTVKNLEKNDGLGMNELFSMNLYKIENPKGNQIFIFELFNVIGQKIYRNEFHDENINLMHENNISPGLYFYRISNKDNPKIVYKSGKIIIIK